MYLLRFSPTAGNLLVGVVSYPNLSSAVVSGITDNQSQTWIQASGAAALVTTANQATDIWYFPNTAAGVTSVTLSGTSTSVTLTIYEIGNAATSSPLDGSAGHVSNQATNTTMTGPSITTAQYGSFIVAVFGGSTASFASVLPYIKTTTLSGASVQSYIPNGTVTGNQATATHTTSTYCASAAAFKSNGNSIVIVTKNNATSNMVGSWETFEFPA